MAFLIILVVLYILSLGAFRIAYLKKMGDLEE